MDLSSYARRAAGFDTEPLTDAEIKKLGRLLDRGASLADVFSAYRAELGGHSLKDFCRAQQVYREYITWRDELQSMVTQRRDSGQQLIPNSAIGQTWTPSCIHWLSLVAGSHTPDDYATHSVWHEVMNAAAELWAAGFSRALSEARLTLPAAEEQTSDDDASQGPLEVPTHRWLALRATSESIDIALPHEGLTDLAGTLSAQLTDDQREALVQQMLDALPEAVFAAVDRRCVVQHITGICAVAMNPEEEHDPTGAVELSASDTERLSEVLASVQAIQNPPSKAPNTAGGARRKKEGEGRKPRSARPGGRSGGRSGTGRGGRRSKTVYNPGLQSIRDLASGLELKGRVRNTNRFGTFVDVGIDKEGLIPVRVLQASSQDGSRVKIPNGTMVLVRVRNVDAGRNRFDLEYLGQASSDER